MNPASSAENAPHNHIHAESGPAAGYFTEVVVFAGTPHAMAETLELLHEFFSDAAPAVRTLLGRFLIACHPDENTGDPSMEVTILLNELNEAADLLHALSGDTREEPPA
jgi:hypothetical protein